MCVCNVFSNILMYCSPTSECFFWFQLPPINHLYKVEHKSSKIFTNIGLFEMDMVAEVGVRRVNGCNQLCKHNL